MRERRGLPIAAYLGMLAGLSLAAAFVATLAIVIFLPPRPPDVMRTDIVADNFQAGYDHMIALGRTMNERGMIWDVRAEPPEEIDSPAMRATQERLAQALDLDAAQVRIQAANVVQSDVYVFRVQDFESWTEDTVEAAEEAERIVEEAQQAHEAALERVEAARERIRELEQDRARLDAESAMDAARERELDRQTALAEAIAERQAAAAERLAERIRQSIRLQHGGRVIVRRREGGGESVEVHTIPASPDGEAVTVVVPGFEVEAPSPVASVAPPAPTPPVAAAPPAPNPTPAPSTRPIVVPAPPAPPMFALFIVGPIFFYAQLSRAPAKA